MFSKRSGRLIAAGLAALAIVDALLRFHWNPDVTRETVLHDPGKTFFHLFLLPPAVLIIWSVARHVSSSAEKPVRASKLVGFLMVALVVGVVVSTWNTQKSLGTSLTAAEDLRPRDLRQDVIKMRRDVTADSCLVLDLAEPTEVLDKATCAKRRAAKIVGPVSLGDLFRLMSPRRWVASTLAAYGTATAVFLLFLIALSSSKLKEPSSLLSFALFSSVFLIAS